VPAIQSYFIEPIWEQFCTLLPEREVNHPLGCHRSRVPDQVVFEKLVQVLVFGCAYWKPVPVCGSDGQRCTATFPNPRDADASYTLETNEGRATDN
jgi:hypothetical protein